MKQKQWEKIFRDNTLFESSDPKNAFRKVEEDVVEEEQLDEGKLKWKKEGKSLVASDNKYDYEIVQGRNMVSLDVWDKKLRQSAKQSEDPEKADEVSYEGGGTFKTVEDAKASAERGKY